MASLLDDIARETGGSSFKTFKYGFDGIEVPRFDYDDHPLSFTWKKYGETSRHRKETIPLKERADQILKNKPLFCYFLDGSRKAYKVDDISYRRQIFPIIAGQVGVGCCQRENGRMTALKGKCVRHLLISLPKIAKKSDWDDDELSFENLRGFINRKPEIESKNVSFSKITAYTTNVDRNDKIENKGIATIQNYMTYHEQEMVASMVKEGYLIPERYLLKDGSLEYQVHGIKKKSELERYRDNYRFVVGASKSFNPAYCIDKNGKNNSSLIAQLPLYSRTPAQMYDSPIIGDMKFAVWFVRIRDSRYTNNTFDGILKLEKILVTDKEMDEGLESEEIDIITANIINERNPVCYGADHRWANHLYPIYVTEGYVKSKYLSDSVFLSLF